MKKKIWITGLMTIMSLFLLPVLAFASSNPMDKIDEMTKPKWTFLDGLEFIFTPVNLLISIMIFAAFVIAIVRLVNRVLRASSGKAPIKDKGFWIEMAIILFILILFFTGALGSVLKSMYNWTEKQDIGGTGTTAIKVERSVDSFLA